MGTMIKPTINIFSENIYDKWQVDEAKLIDIGRTVLNYYINRSDIYENSCLNIEDFFDTITFDILYCDGEKTHQINKEYRDKDYVADIITFAIFADEEPEQRFIFDGEINLGEIILALDKIAQSAQEKGVTKEEELCFLLAHGIMHLLGFDHQTEEDYNFVVNAQNEALKMIEDKNV
jgi:probable rRNA maturation factor